jgi:ABC-2 type transport system permease protein
MTAALVSITLRALLNRRRTVLLALLGVLMIGIVGLYLLSNPTPEQALEVTRTLLSDLALGVLLPLVAVIVGTAAIGSELDDGTIVYLLARPVPRWRIVIVKLLVAWVVVTILVAPATLVAGLIGQDDPALAIAFAVSAAIGALEYVAIFVALSLITSRALIIGLAYVVVWEGVVAGLFAGTRVISVRQHALAVVEAIGGGDATGIAEVALEVAIAAVVIITVGATILAVRRLETVELRGETA